MAVANSSVARPAGRLAYRSSSASSTPPTTAQARAGNDSRGPKGWNVRSTDCPGLPYPRSRIAGADAKRAAGGASWSSMVVLRVEIAWAREQHYLQKPFVFVQFIVGQS